jgi:heme/copper-type cytochrome/quinol oxidase subunit 3
MAGGDASASRPLVASLFVASCLLSIVSWYTTQQGMALYLSPWFALLASLGVQSSLVVVAWLVGFNRSRSALLIAVYVITAVVSIVFSYVSLYTWFSARERPATVERRLYDALNAATGKSQESAPRLPSGL